VKAEKSVDEWAGLWDLWAAPLVVEWVGQRAGLWDLWVGPLVVS